MATDLAERIDDVLRRRNRMVHGMVEDVAVATALVTGEGIEEVLSWIAVIETDCRTLVEEIQPLAYEALKERYGLDMDLEKARALINLYGTSERPDS